LHEANGNERKINKQKNIWTHVCEDISQIFGLFVGFNHGELADLAEWNVLKKFENF